MKGNYWINTLLIGKEPSENKEVILLCPYFNVIAPSCQRRAGNARIGGERPAILLSVSRLGTGAGLVAKSGARLPGLLFQ